MAVVFPRKLLIEADHDWNIAGSSMVGGQTSSTPMVDVRSDGGGFWLAALNNMQFFDRSYTLLWRALRQLCNGGVVPIVVERNDIAFAPYPAGLQPQVVHFSDTSPFSDGSGFDQSLIDIRSNGSAGLRATSMPFVIFAGNPLQGGEAFSIQHPTWGWRMYEIATVVMTDSVRGTITFNPPLREEIDEETPLEFDRPRCTMKLLNPSAMDLNVTTWPFSCPSVKFIESKFS